MIIHSDKFPETLKHDVEIEEVVIIHGLFFSFLQQYDNKMKRSINKDFSKQLPNKKTYKAPNLVSVLENDKILKIGHFLRFDKSGLEFFLKCKMKNIFDTKIASKIVRTYTDAHGLKNLVQEFCNKSLDKRQGSSDWNKDINDLYDKQLEYAANDVIYLHKIKSELEKMLKRENRMELFENCIKFLDTRIKLDQSGFKFDIFEH